MADIVTTRVFTDGEKGITAAKLNDIVASSTIQPAFVSSKPTASTADPADSMLLLKAAGTYAQVPFSTVVSSVNTQLPSSDSEIWSVRLRSFNAAGNPNFEVDQRNVGTALTNSANGAWLADRWTWGQAASAGKITAQRTNELVPIPGTSYNITQTRLRLTLTTQQTTLGATDYFVVSQTVEGCNFRELIGDVNSISLLVRSSVANLKFGLKLGDPGAARTLVKLCTIPTANVWTLIQLPNLPVIPSGGNFGFLQGVAGYVLNICLGAGTTWIAPAAGTWQNGNFIGAPGQDNFFSQAVNSTFDIAMMQHEPGAVCSTLMDKPFTGADGNFEECLRYYQKTYDHLTVPGAVTSTGLVAFNTAGAATLAYGPLRFHKPMAKTPTVALYNWNTGAVNSVQDGAGTNHASASAANVGTAGFSGVTFTTATAAANGVYAHYTADTGW